MDNNKIYLENIKKICVEKSNNHYNKSYKYKIYNNILSLPGIILPIVSGGITPFLTADVNIIFQPTIMIIIGILNSILSFFNFKTNIKIHNEKGNSFNDIVEKIDLLLINSNLIKEDDILNIKKEKENLDDEIINLNL